ncbi:pyrophosphatase PpaX [Solibacillus sp. R5-41]|uniref:pyrophosphatase PpaX n=1 Tax=Solibacillus sp. R5-41 TaxID=2048654 RepID=UPI000C1284D8|nr:pyrophosphatase PpaX [Solibacillus sp. R5-41]ATP41744.1 pyrophosphatase PpaX [Solibacillus sp. R5-41]
MKTKALLFDFDGTLLDTNDLIIQTFMQIFDEKFPGQYTTQDCLKFIGPSLKQTFDELTPGETDEMIAKYKKWNAEHHDQLVKGYDAVLETLEQLHAMGIKLAIVSTKGSEGLARGMNVLGAGHLFDVIVGLDDVTHVKPHPEPILLALKKLGVTKEEAIMIGDNSHDIEGGKNAGVRTAGVSWAAKGEAFLQQFNPDYMLHHMRDLLAIVKEV